MKSAKGKRSSFAPTGNRTQGKCLEGIYVTTTPLVLLLCLKSHSCVIYCCARNLHVFIPCSSPFHHSFSTPSHHLSLIYTTLTNNTIEINHIIYQEMSMSFLITQYITKQQHFSPFFSPTFISSHFLLFLLNFIIFSSHGLSRNVNAHLSKPSRRDSYVCFSI